jgi:aminomethyltransferase
VRSAAGLFDLSHMGEIAVTGPGAGAALDYALTGWPAQLAVGRARYTMICAPDGGILDDLVVYRQADDRFLVVANASNTSVVLDELTQRVAIFNGTVLNGTVLNGTVLNGTVLNGTVSNSTVLNGTIPGASATVSDETGQTALIAVQGPKGSAIIASQGPATVTALKYYSGCYAEVAGVPAWVARTGYTGEDGFEVFCPAGDAERVWASLTEAGGADLVPAGLAARDTLRLEAGMPLYGNELGRGMTPFEAGLGRVVRLDKPGDFVGREALAKVAAAVAAGGGPDRALIGLIARSRRIPRHGYPVLSGSTEVGTVTSGAPSPTLGVPVAMAYVTLRLTEPGAGTEFGIDVRGRIEPADLVKLPFYRRSQQA